MKKFVVAGTALVVLATAILITIPFRAPYLVLYNDNSGAILLSHRADDGETFAIEYIHSVNKSPVTEFYQIREQQIWLTALEFYTFGAGMPTELEPGQELVRLQSGALRIEGYDRDVTDLRYLVGHAADITLKIGAQRVHLDTLAEAGQSVRFEINQLSL